jgi:hypothetical protein
MDIKQIYYAAINKCVESGHSMAWLFEKYYAELIIEQCAKIAEDASDRRIPASEYGDLIRQFKRLEP